jgi:hypothetical protein
MFNYPHEVSFEDKMLWAAVLRRAVFDYVLYKGVRQHSLEWKRACQYIYTPGIRYENGLSFEEVCVLFDWNSDYLRRLTSRLTKADIKKMEVSQIREEFTFNLIEAVVRCTARWKDSRAAVPFFPCYEYSEEYRQKMVLKVVQKEKFLGELVPLVSWQSVSA